ncbi:MAG: hypothetical protein KKD18_00360 [Nanoarchaeota archaeon]|nr:hypothetical protein [Nanoarchaeota archaeon]MBU0976851.1 hypothetical protein [Nanoarchaeota archaeon]
MKKSEIEVYLEAGAGRICRVERVLLCKRRVSGNHKPLSKKIFNRAEGTR